MLLDVIFAIRQQCAVTLAKIAMTVDATHMHILKPDTRADWLGCEALGHLLEQIEFVNDQPRNLEGARRAGLDAVPFDVTKPAASFAEAERRFGLKEQVS